MSHWTKVKTSLATMEHSQKQVAADRWDAAAPVKQRTCIHAHARCWRVLLSEPPFISPSDMLMPLIHIGNRTELSTADARGGAWISSRCFERCVADCIGVHGVLTICCAPDCIDSLPWALPNSLFSSQKMAYCSA